MKKKAWIVSAVTVAVFLLLAVALDLLLPVSGLDRWLLWVGMSVLGAAAAVLVYLHFAPRAPPPVAIGTGPEGEIDLPLEAARKALSASGVGGGRIDRLPLVLLLGPPGSAKTTVVQQGGLEPELLAGEVSRAGTVVPTRSVNIWYTQGGIVLDAGGAVLNDAPRWNRLLHHLCPGRVAAALGRGGQASRQAVVCFSCEELVRAGAGEAVAAAAAQLRVRLVEISQELGIRLPVYVLFTKADRLPHFEDFVRNLSREEAQAPVGATLPLVDIAAGAYADQQSARLRSAFQSIFRSLSQWRLRLLPREARGEQRAGAYEFPRELLKASALAEQFLIELCRPSQLGVNPFLRGFYFTGVRPVVVGEAAPEAPVAQNRVALGATGVFSLQGMQQPTAPAASRSATRRIPDWTFLRHLLPDIVQRDRVAMALTGGGQRVDMLRRAIIGAACALLLLLSVGFTVSYFGNRALAGQAIAAVRGVEPLRASVAEVPPLGDLQRLDELRAVLVRLRGYQVEGRPGRLGWGLYAGESLLTESRRAYFDRFERLIWDGVRDDLLVSVRTLPVGAQDASRYGATYDALKAHLITTTYPAGSSAEFLTPVLLRSWRLSGNLDARQTELVRRQLDFFAEEMRFGNPYPGAADETAVVAARSYLQDFTGAEPLFRALLAEAAADGQPVVFERLYPAAAAVVRNPVAVPPEFTERGWARAQAALKNVDRLLEREDWVVGERALIPAGERPRIIEELRSQYVGAYIGAWREYLRGASVLSFSGPEDAARKLALLSGNQSPLLELLALASRHTAVDSVEIAKAFQPVHAVVPPGAADQLVDDEANGPYVNALAGLHSAMAQAATAGRPGQADALAQAASSASQVSMAVSQLAQRFSIGPDAREAGLSVQRLLLAPTGGIPAMARALPAAEINGKGPAFCRPFNQLAARYPFNPRGGAEATVDEVTAVLQPGNSALWTFYDESLRDLIVQQGPRYSGRVGANPAPTNAFVSFFDRAARISGSLFPEAGGEPEVSFALRPQTSEAIPEVRVAVDGPGSVFTRTVAAARTFTWNGARAQSARITAQVGGADVTVAEATGPWAIFRVLRSAEWRSIGGGRYSLAWRIPQGGGSLTAEYSGSPVFSPDFLSGLNCVSQIVR